jgi:hypothetical protein
MSSLINLLQVEAVRAQGYKPKSSKPYIDLTSQATANLDNHFSDHATYVAQLWQDHGGADLVAKWFVVEQANFDLNLVRPGRAFPPANLQNIHIAIMPCGETWEGVSNIAITKLQAWAEAQNCLIFKSPSDLGQGFHQSPCQAVGDNIITIASSTTGSETAGMPPIDLFFPVDWNSYAQPAALSVGGVFAFVDWLLRNTNWDPKMAKTLLLSTAQADSKGRKTLNGGAALAQAKLHYGPPAPLPLPPMPAPTPTPTPAPQPVTPPAPVTPPPSTGAKPVISQFDHGVTSAWSGPGNDTTTLFFRVSGADSVVITDPKGVTRDVTGRTNIKVTGKYSGGSTFILIASNAFGSSSLTHSQVHGCFAPDDL